MTLTHEQLPEPTTVAADATTMCAAFQAVAAEFAGETAIRSHDGAVTVTFGQYAERVRRIAAGLAALGVGRGDTVALLLTNRPEFQLVDTAAIHLGAVPFSVYATSAPEQIAYLFENSGADVIVTEQAFLPRVEQARAGRSTPSHVVVVDGAAEGAITLEQLEERGDPGFDVEAAWRAVQPDDVLTLIYTSGTTGPPKGVELTHANMLAQCRSMGRVLPIRPGARITSYLPSAHIADRWASHYNQMMFGIQVTTVPDPRTIAQVLPEVRPTIWGAVPRILEKIKAALEAGLAGEPDEERRAAVQRALGAARQKVQLEQAGEAVPEELAQGVAQADELIFSKLRAKLGLEQAEWIICGAAPLSREVHEFLLAIGLPVTELYGMSEASCCVTVSPPGELRIGTVGKPIDCVEVKVAEDGEMLLKGDTIMRGYRNDPERTAEAFDGDGWLQTGDIIELTDGYVKIVDRKKELIINAGGKNMSPANIEKELKSASPLIGQACVVGNARPYNVALLVLDPDMAAAKAKQLGLEDASVAAVAADERIKAEVAEAVERANEKLARVEQVKKHALLAEEWLPGGDELTPTMKLKRKPIDAKHADAIEALYAS
ncbi:MAG TPA: long-chain fatty acid--CoA ligase [Baekduia sp.]|nr:long-chain fatty acid--CoA ligase [Baekduia sp.]